jgi:sulfide:quinone oxidoreductase
MSRTVVVLGAGVGGLTAAAKLRELLPAGEQVILVDRAFDSALGLSLLWVLRGWRAPEQVRVTPSATSLPGVDMVTAEVERIAFDERTVHTTRGPVRYDALVVALGAALNAASVPGLREALATGVAGEFYTADGAAALHDRLNGFDRGRLAVLVAGVPFKCPAAPFEAALLASDLLLQRGVREHVQIDTYTPDPLPMPVAGPAVGKALVGLLEQQEIGFHPNRTVERVDADAKELVFAGGDRVPFDLLAVVPPHEAPAPAAASGLGPAGWVPVDARTLATAVDAAWAIGDTTLLVLPNGKPLPKAGVFAEGEAEVVAAGIARYLGYDAPERYFDGFGSCYIEVGDRRAAKGEGYFLAPSGPEVTLHEPAARYHREKLALETAWLDRWNARAEAGAPPPR